MGVNSGFRSRNGSGCLQRESLFETYVASSLQLSSSGKLAMEGSVASGLVEEASAYDFRYFPVLTRIPRKSRCLVSCDIVADALF